MLQKLSEQLIKHFSEVTGKSINEGDKQQLNSLVQASLARANLVNREEFDIQCKVLERTRSKIDALEQQLKALANE